MPIFSKERDEKLHKEIAMIIKVVKYADSEMNSEVDFAKVFPETYKLFDSLRKHVLKSMTHVLIK